jgi:hypothetical protein
MKNNVLLTNHVPELLYQALETETGGVQIYTTALAAASSSIMNNKRNFASLPIESPSLK